MISRISETDVALVHKAAPNAKVLAAAPRLKLVAVCATGTNHINLVAAHERGIRVTNGNGYDALTG